METQRNKSKKKPIKIEEMTKEQIRQAILKKQECNAKAQDIVESLLEKSISESYFLKCLPDINQSHFNDVIEERSIAHLCGYPICPKPLLEKDIPKQKYRISVKTNKVYDITTRKCFCSNTCYKAAMHVNIQMLTSPLWFREYEEIPKFQLMPLDTIGSLGQEIDVALTEKISIKGEKQSFTSINDFANAGLCEMTEYQNENKETEIKGINRAQFEKKDKNKNNNCVGTTMKENKNNDPLKSELTADKDNIEEFQTVNPSPIVTKEFNKGSQNRVMQNPLNIVGEIIEKPMRRIDPIVTNVPEKSSPSPKQNTKPIKTVLTKKQPSVTVITIEVEKCLAQWFTIDTLIFLLGEEKVKEMVTDKGECIKEYLNNYAKGIFYTSNSYDQYQALCRKLNMLELEDRRFDTQILQRETKPLPDYSILQEESKRMQLQVRAFFDGETEIPGVDSVVKSNSSTIEESNLTQLPLVDKNAQNALRRRIVCQHLNKVLPDLLRSLGLLTLSISSDVRLLVNTFKLKANNVMFKPIQWTLIAIVVIKLLSLRDQRLEYLLEQVTAFQHMQLLLLSYKQDGGYLDRLISWLTDVDRLLDTNDTQLTIE